MPVVCTAVTPAAALLDHRVPRKILDFVMPVTAFPKRIQSSYHPQTKKSNLFGTWRGFSRYPRGKSRKIGRRRRSFSAASLPARPFTYRTARNEPLLALPGDVSYNVFEVTVMFNTKKFGLYLSRFRKNADMTQSFLAERLNLTRQAISAYERGESFPDVSILVSIADIFGVTLDTLIGSGDPTHGEAAILRQAAEGGDNDAAQTFSDVENLAPLLKPSVLKKLSEKLFTKGIDISHVVSLAEYLADDAVADFVKGASFDNADEELLGKLIPILDEKSKGILLQKMIEGEMDWHFIKVLLPYAEYMTSLIEAAVVEGALPKEALNAMREGLAQLWDKWQTNGEL